MPTKRTRRIRSRVDLLPEEREWLTGQPVEGAGRLWSFRGGEKKVRRCREIIAAHGHLIPEGRMEQLENDIRRWSPVVSRGLASFRRGTEEL